MVRTGIGFDVHKFAGGRKLVLGGVEIDHHLGLDGHSDADVLCHALADALFGSIADGDIGAHFPDTDAKWKDARSLEMLETVAGRLKSKGVTVLNVDSTVICENPELAPYIRAMRENIAGALGIGGDCVSVKATTAERIGSLGREEGIAVMAVATVEEM